MDGDDVEKGRERNAEKEEERGERDATGGRAPEHRPRERDQKPDQADFLQPHLNAPDAEEAERERRDEQDERQAIGTAGRFDELPPLGPEDVKGEKRHVPGKRHVFLGIREDVRRMVEEKRPEPPNEGSERERQKGNSDFSLHFT